MPLSRFGRMERQVDKMSRKFEYITITKEQPLHPLSPAEAVTIQALRMISFLALTSLGFASIMFIAASPASGPIGLRPRSDGTCEVLDPGQPCPPEPTLLCCGRDIITCNNGFYALLAQPCPVGTLCGFNDDGSATCKCPDGRPFNGHTGCS